MDLMIKILSETDDLDDVDSATTAACGIVFSDDFKSVWLVSPTNYFGGYKWTFPKGRISKKMPSLKETALNEVLEEAGISAKIIGPAICTAAGTTTITTYFPMLALSTGGAIHKITVGGKTFPESQDVQLVPIKDLGNGRWLNMPRDLKTILPAIQKYVAIQATENSVKKK